MRCLFFLMAADIISLIFLAPKKRNTVLSHCYVLRGAPLCHTHPGDDAKDMCINYKFSVHEMG